MGKGKDITLAKKNTGKDSVGRRLFNEIGGKSL